MQAFVTTTGNLIVTLCANCSWEDIEREWAYRLAKSDPDWNHGNMETVTHNGPDPAQCDGCGAVHAPEIAPPLWSART